MSEERKQLRLFISGKVQGVWFRAWTEQEANRLGLAGWVRNREDGRVEAVFLGAADQVEAMLELCRKGPPAARVESIESQIDRSEIDPGSGFHQAPTV